jgi:hypothetical protein
MPSARDVAAALYGAWRLMRFDAGGLTWFDASLTGFWRSFFAAVVVAPAFALLVWLEFQARTEPFNGAWAALVMSVTYVLGWAVFPLAAIPITRLLSLSDRYVPLIVAYNWISVPQVVLFLVVGLAGGRTADPSAAAMLLEMGAVAYILVYQWFVVRAALQTNALTAAAIVILDIVLGELLYGSANSLI